MGFPVSIIIPHQKSREEFFRRYCLPSVRISGAAEIFIEDWEGGACEKRNAGAAKATQPYLLFVDDDTVLSRDCVARMLRTLERSQDCGYAYSSFVNFAWPGVDRTDGPVQMMRSEPFNGDTLRQRNYIDTTTLVRRSVFPGFSPSFKRLQDWDLWLTLLGRGVKGVFIDDVLFMKFTIDRGISERESAADAHQMIRQKHGL